MSTAINEQLSDCYATKYKASEVLDLSNRGLHISNWSAEPFSSRQTIKYLNLSNNYLEECPDLSLLASTLEVLNLSNCNMCFFKVPYLEKMLRLQTLILNDNNIRFCNGIKTNDLCKEHFQEMKKLSLLPHFKKIVARSEYPGYRFEATKEEICQLVGTRSRTKDAKITLGSYNPVLTPDRAHLAPKVTVCLGN